ncbi:hypothetical protein D6F26_16065 [Salmonella enterica]|uniref:hypothetical protein n=1 Tax=Erwinia amylovora TaxID=552 RepID=UPI001077154E|nr:hypothetical protein [Erwinia amylovora]EAB4047417.1 hypothetical protein [Salmonella enterica]HBR0962965.1 hypothetical protein [Klebsiella pneumoniae]HDS4462687.1 hypothetical protein [Escherichia coli]EFQ8828048.1 hypothetical protein [Salmonella enterica]EHI7937672.1 hypothetical protein [Salmonella enterica]
MSITIDTKTLATMLGMSTGEVLTHLNNGELNGVPFPAPVKATGTRKFRVTDVMTFAKNLEKSGFNLKR